jgi:predicted RNase H-like HicB family nuclease
MKFGVVFEDSENGVGAFLPDVPGLAVVGDSKFDALAMLDIALQWHIEGLLEDGDPLPAETANPQQYQWLLSPQRMFVAKVPFGGEYLRISDGDTGPTNPWLLLANQALREESSHRPMELTTIA